MTSLWVLGVVAGVGVAEARPLTNIVQLAAGTDHACAVLESGEVACWGDVDPKPASGDPRAPALISGVTGAIGIAASSGGTCALLGSGEVSCWGVDWYIGRNQTTTGHGRQPPGLVAGLTDAVEIAMGLGFAGACARHRDGRVSCWGDNRYGHLGTPTPSERAVAPVQVPGVTSAVELAVGITGACARLASGEVTCWGSGDWQNATAPAKVPGVRDAVGVTVGQQACVLHKTGAVSCWKADDQAAVPADAGVAGALALRDNGVSIQCVILRDRKVACWGSGLEGPGGVRAKTPTAIANLVNVKQIAPGGRFACALLATKQATCWGTNYARQLGRATPNIVTAPTTVRGVRGATAVAVGKTTTCAIVPAGVVCWGGGRPVTPIANTQGAAQLTVGEDRACVRTALGKAACWDVTGSGPAVDEPGFDSATHVDIDRDLCITRQDGSVKCNDRDRGWSAVAAAAEVHADGFGGGCARTTTNLLTCWGSRLHHMSAPSRNRPAPLTATTAKDVLQFDLNGPLLCMLQKGEARCESGVQIWQDDGVRGGTDLVSIKDPSLAQIAVGWAHACVRRTTGTVACWGYNHGGQLGSGTLDDQPRSQPVPVALAGPAIGLAARENTSCAVLRGGTVQCWGTNRDGQVGTGASGNVYVPGAPVEAP